MSKKTSGLDNEWPKLDSWSSGGVWLAYTLFYGFMPLWLGVLAGLGFSNHPIAWPDFLIHGEFLIYAASLTAASTRLIASDANAERPFAHRQIFNLISGAVIIPSAAAYAIVKVLTFFNLVNQIKSSFMIWFSIPTLIFSIVFSFFVFVLDHQRNTTPINVEAQIKEQQDELSDDFDQLEKSEVANRTKTEDMGQRGDENAR